MKDGLDRKDLESWEQCKKDDVIFVYDNRSETGFLYKIIKEGIPPELEKIAEENLINFSSIFVPIFSNNLQNFKEQGYKVKLVNKKDLVLYSHWQTKTKKYFDLLEEITEE
jgi:hypothetical protein